jgi:hypothetical protein
MLFILRFVILYLFLSLSLGCTGDNSYNIGKDAVIADLNSRIGELNEELTTLTSELDQVRVVLDDKEIDIELKKSVRKEILEGERHILDIEQWIAYLKVQRKQRYQSLKAREGQKGLSEQAKAETTEYFAQKKLKPIKKAWLERYRTAVEL